MRMNSNVLCRLCLMKCEELFGMYITSSSGVLRSLPKIIRECISLEVTDLEPHFFSKFVCNECIYKLELFYAFRQQSLKSQEYYNGLLQYYQQAVPCTSKLPVIESTSEPVQVQGSGDGVFVVAPEQQIQLDQSVHSNNELADINFSANEFMMDETEKNQLSKDYDDIIRSLQKDDLDFTTNDEELVIKHELEISIPLRQDKTHKQDAVQPECANYIHHHIDGRESVVQPMEPSSSGCFEQYNPIDSITCDKELAIDSIDRGHTVEQDDDPSYDDFAGIQTTSLEDNREMALSEAHVQEIIEDVYDVTPDKVQPTDDLRPPARNENSHTTEFSHQTNEQYFPMVDYDEPEPVSASSSNTVGVIDSTQPANDKTCEVCHKTFRTRQKLAIHRNTHLRLAPFKCTFDGCAKAFKSRIGLEEHVARHTNSFEYTCEVCSKGFQHRSYLSAHRRAHNTERNFQCGLCGQAFKAKQALLEHKNSHLGVKPFACGQCDKQYTKNSLLQAHIRQQHEQRGDDAVTRHPCLECGKQFTSKSYLTVHMRIHRNDRPFVCEICNKGHVTRKDLAVHMTSHTGEKPHSCDICDKTYARRNALDWHRRSHTKERPYICDICGQTFSQSTPLQVHRKLHDATEHKKQSPSVEAKPTHVVVTHDHTR
uniref:Protein krueppel n=1 Tax=Anopheles farauti TaxID=69004 RepID=A0A182QQN4_9DIPT